MSLIAETFLRSIVRISVPGSLLVALAVPAQGPRQGAQAGGMELVSCDAPSGLVFVKANAPTRVEGWAEPRVTFTGHVETPRDYCADEVRIFGQRKVCGTFGCNYHTVEKSPYVEFDRVADLKLFHDCKSGTHRYRTIVEYTAPNVANPQNRFFVMDMEDRELSC